MSQEQQPHPEQTDTNKIDGSALGNQFGNPSAAERYKNGLGTSATANTAPPTGETLSESTRLGPTGTGMVDTGVQGGEPVQNRTTPLQPHTEAESVS